MTMDRYATIWVPSALGAASLILSLLLPKMWPSMPLWMILSGIAVALLLWAWAIWLAYRGTRIGTYQGGRGGNAWAAGEDSQARGGHGGSAGRGNGGDGGAAVAKGKGSIAKGGDGGQG